MSLQRCQTEYYHAVNILCSLNCIYISSPRTILLISVKAAWPSHFPQTGSIITNWDESESNSCIGVLVYRNYYILQFNSRNLYFYRSMVLEMWPMKARMMRSDQWDFLSLFSDDPSFNGSHLLDTWRHLVEYLWMNIFVTHSPVLKVFSLQFSPVCYAFFSLFDK